MMKKWRTFLGLVPDMVYNGIAYEIKRLAQRDLLAGMTLTQSTHQDVDTS